MQMQRNNRLSRAEKKQLRKLILEEKQKKNSGITSKNVKQNTGLKLKKVTPLTAAQDSVFAKWEEGKNLLLHGYPGTGKTFLAMYLGLQDITDYQDYNSILIVRSTVPIRDQGFLPGKADEKSAEYEAPYKQICNELYGRGDAYELLKQKGMVDFKPTSYLQGISIHKTIIIVDEFENMCFRELDNIFTRLGKDSRIIFSGDIRQSALQWSKERQGAVDFMEILRNMRDHFTDVEFQEEDIVRSGIVKSYILQKIKFEDAQAFSEKSERDYKVYY